MIRGNTIKYSSYKKKQQLEEERKLEQEIKILENEVNRNFLNMTEEALHTLETKKSIFNEEKPTQYFFNLEKRNYTSKVIHKLVNTEGEEFTNTADILKCQTNFYKDLYKQCDHKDSITIQSVLGENESKLSDKDSQDLEGEILYSELAFALKNMKNNKSPGLDGFTVDFFKFFWIDIDLFILKSLNYGYRTGSLSITQKQGVINCIPKPNKSRCD